MPDDVRWKLLVVDDEADIRLLMTAFLSSIDGAEVLACRDGEEVGRAFDGGYVPDFALVDWHLTGDGTARPLLETMARRFPSCTVFLATGSLSRHDAAFSDLPVQAVLEKPYALSDLLERVVAVLSGRAVSHLGQTKFPHASSRQLEMLRELVDERPDDVAGRHLLAFSLYTSGRFEEAREEYGFVDSRDHRTYLTKYYEGHVHARLRDFRRALACWREALKLADAPLLAEKARHRIAQAIDLMGLERSLTDTRPGHAHAPKAQ